MSRAASGDTAGGAHDGDRPLFVLLGLALASVFWSIAALELFTAAFITLGIARQIRTAAPLPRGGSLPFLLWLVYACGMLAAVALSPFAASAGYLNKHWHAFVFPCLLLLRPRTADLRLPALMLVASGAAASAAALVRLGLEGGNRLQPLYVGEMTFALGALAAGIVAAACLAEVRCGASARWTAAGALALITAALVMSTGRAAVFLLALAVAILLARWDYRALAAWLATLAAAFAAAPERLRMKFEWLLAGRPLERYAVWGMAAEPLRKLPLTGFGPGTFRELVPVLPPGVDPGLGSWHSEPLQTLIEGGWGAALAYAALVTTALLRSGRTVRRSPLPAAGRTAVMLVLLALAAEGLVNALASSPAVSVLWWTALAAASSFTDGASDP